MILYSSETGLYRWNLDRGQEDKNIFLCAHPEEILGYRKPIYDHLREQNLQGTFFFHTEQEQGQWELPPENALQHMDLFALVLTEKFLTEPNPARDQELPYAKKQGIPVAVFMEEPEKIEENQAACTELCRMYQLGLGVTADPEQALYWREKQLALARRDWQEDPGRAVFLNAYLSCLWTAAGEWRDLGNQDRCRSCLQEMAACCRDGLQNGTSDPAFYQNGILACSSLMNMAQEREDGPETEQYALEVLELSRQLCEKHGIRTPAPDQIRLFDCLLDLREKQGRLAEAREFGEKKLELLLQIVQEAPSEENLHGTFAAYYTLGDLAEKEENVHKAESYFKSALRLLEDHPETGKSQVLSENLRHTLRHLGLMAWQRDSKYETRMYYRRCADLYEQRLLQEKKPVYYAELGDLYEILYFFSEGEETLDCLRRIQELYLQLPSDYEGVQELQKKADQIRQYLASLKESTGFLHFRTLDGSSPRGKRKIYFCAHPEDYGPYFEETCKEIFDINKSCAIYYCSQVDQRKFSEFRREMLEEFDLFVIPVTTRLLTTKNPVTDWEFPVAQGLHIPVLTLVQEPELEELYGEIFGTLQFLDKTHMDRTAIPYEEKLQKYLQGVLIGDELVRKIQAAFDAHIFLSYRKKDRRHAKELMRLIHSNEFFRDVGIWYDEYLVPGEKFDEEISSHMVHSDLFTLLVTPNLVNEENYVRSCEYPDAKDFCLPILPVEAVPTDRKLLENQYEDIPPCVVMEKPEELSRELRARLEKIALQENNADPWHNYFMGLAYLEGIDVEKNGQRACELLEKARLPEACSKLSQMYRWGSGVERNEDKVLFWLERQTELLQQILTRDKNTDTAFALAEALAGLAMEAYIQEKPGKAAENWRKNMEILENLQRILVPQTDLRRGMAESRQMLGAAEKDLGEYEKADGEYEKSQQLLEQLVSEVPSRENLRALTQILLLRGDYFQYLGDMTKASEFYNQIRTIAERLMKEFPGFESTRIMIDYHMRCCKLQLEYLNLQSAEWDCRKAVDLALSMEKAYAGPDNRRIVAQVMVQYSKILENCEKYPEALEAADQGLGRYLELEDSQGTIQSRCSAAGALGWMGNMMMRRNRQEEAQDFCQKELAHWEALARQRSTPRIRRGTADALLNIGTIYILQKAFEEAEAAFRRSLSILQQETEDMSKWSSMARVLEQLGILMEIQEKTPEAEAFYKEGLALWQKAKEIRQGLRGYASTVYSWEKLGQFYLAQNQFELAETCFREALQEHRWILHLHGKQDDRELRRQMYLELVKSLKAQEKYPAAERALRQAIAIRQQLTLDQEDTDLCIDYWNLGEILKAQGKEEEALKYFDWAQALLYKADPEKMEAQSPGDWMAHWDHLAQISLSQENLSEAEKYYRKCLEIAEQQVRENPGNRAWEALSISCYHLGNLLLERSDLGHNIFYNESEEYLKRALEIDERLAEEDPGIDRIRKLSQTYSCMKWLMDKLNRDEEARKYAEKALEMDRALAKTDPEKYLSWQNLSCSNMALLMENAKDYEKAEAYYRKSLEISEKCYQQAPTEKNLRDLGDACRDLGELLSVRKKYEEAGALLARGLEISRQILKENPGTEQHENLAWALTQAGRAARKLGKKAEAQNDFREALEIRQKIFEEVPNRENRQAFADSCQTLGRFLRSRGKKEEARRYFQRAMLLREQLQDSSIEEDLELAVSYYDLGTVQEKGSTGLHSQMYYYRRSLGIFRTFSHGFPQIKPYEHLLRRLKKEVFGQAQE